MSNHRNRETPEDRHQRERIGTAGDPTPDHEYGDTNSKWENLDPNVGPDGAGTGVSAAVLGAARDLADPGLLSDEEALAYILHDVEEVGCEEAAEKLGLSEKDLHESLNAARRKIDQAEQTLNTKMPEKRGKGEPIKWEVEYTNPLGSKETAVFKGSWVVDWFENEFPGEVHSINSMNN